MRNLLFKRVLWLAALCASVFVGLAVYTNVPTELTEQDKAVFVELGLHKPEVDLSFQGQIELMAKLQKETFKRAPLGDGIQMYESREPVDLMQAGKGLCYDRSRFFDKGAKFLALESRHVYLLYKQNKPFWRALISHGQASHAITEIKTKKGWMFVDSNTAWLAVTRNGEPVSAGDVWRRFDEFDSPPLT